MPKDFSQYKLHDLGITHEEKYGSMDCEEDDYDKRTIYPREYLSPKQFPELEKASVGDEVMMIIRGRVTGVQLREHGGDEITVEFLEGSAELTGETVEMKKESEDKMPESDDQEDDDISSMEKISGRGKMY